MNGFIDYTIIFLIRNWYGNSAIYGGAGMTHNFHRALALKKEKTLHIWFLINTIK